MINLLKEHHGMILEEVPLKDELKEGLIKYARDNNISLLSLLESLIEDFLIKKEYLVICDFDNPVEFPAISPIKHMWQRENGKWGVSKNIGGSGVYFGTFEYKDAKEVVLFLESKSWDLKYSTKQTGLRGQKQVDYLFKEMAKDKLN